MNDRPRKPDNPKRTLTSVPHKVSDARRVALYALSDVTIGGAYAGQALDRRLQESHLSPEDRRLTTSLFYAALENRLRIDYLLRQFVRSTPEPIIWEVMHLGAAQILFLDRVPDHAAVDEAVKQVRMFDRSPLAPLVNGALRSLIRARDAGELTYPDREQNPIRHLSIMHSMSEPLVKRLLDAYGLEEAEKILSFQPEDRWETIRPNLLQINPVDFEAYLSRRGFTWRPGPVSLSWQLKRAGDLPADVGFERGLFTLQGSSSMLAAFAMEPKPGMNILDACAAPGGKSALMCELMQDTGRVYAYDLHPHRVELIKALAKRMQLSNLRTAVTDSTVFRPDNEQRMDAVLIDAPCSGLGEIANKADIKFRLKDGDIDVLMGIQQQLLDTCGRYVKPGGLMVYSTCTILPEENQKQVLGFLKNHPEFRPDQGDGWLPERFRPRLKDGMIQFTSHNDEGMDGFFIARLRRAGGRS